MRHLIRLGDLTHDDLGSVLRLADAYDRGDGPSFDGAAAMFFPPTSIRTRAAFELGAARMGLRPVLFPPESLDRGESRADVAAALGSWVDLIVARHGDIAALDELGAAPIVRGATTAASAPAVPIVNAMTGTNHPCEVLGDLWTLRRTDTDWATCRILVVGADGNIARAWAEAATAFGLDVVQCCPTELATPAVPRGAMRHVPDLAVAIRSADVVVTDPPGRHGSAMRPYRVTGALLDTAPDGVRFLPCPPFVRGRELTDDALGRPAFIGFDGKRGLLPVHQAVMAWVLGADA